jgi:hypothetical protein
MALRPADPLVDVRGITLHRAEDRGCVYVGAALLHHFGEITEADIVISESALAQEDDLNRKATAFEDRQWDRHLA